MKLRKVIDKGDPKNKKIAYKFFTEEKGYPKEVALGIIGNLMQESHSNLVTSAVGFDGTGSYGIAQWLGPRKKKLQEIRPEDYDTLRGQLEFIDWELKNTEKRAATKLKESVTIEDATLNFSKYYERPHKDYAHNDKRINYAKKLGESLKETEPLEQDYKEKRPETVIESTTVKQPQAPVNYATLPTETEDKPLTESDIRKILEEERNANVKKAEQSFINAFKQKENPIEEYQPRKQAVSSNLYNYIDVNNY